MTLVVRRWHANEKVTQLEVNEDSIARVPLEKLRGDDMA